MKVLTPLGKRPEMFELPSDSDYDRWLTVFSEASARLDALERAVIDVRYLLRSSDGVHSAEILKVLEQHGV